jgi:uncharacterized membrane protein YphA (DoxX/SURF4 family)
METALWIAQVLLAAIFLLTGTTKLTQPRLKMAAGRRTHVRYAESERLPVPIVVLALALFVAVAGFGTYSA